MDRRRRKRALPASGASLGSRLGLFGLVSLLAGVLVAGLALPVAGGLGLAARSTADGFQALPADLQTSPLRQTSQVLAADGSVLATFYEQNRVSVPLDQVAPIMREAIVAIEDNRFYEHRGVDPRGTLRALVNNSSGRSVQGGSTITQQYVKNALLENALAVDDQKAAKAATDESYGRKLRELRYAVALEEQLAKDEILSRYLNIAYFGNGAYGVEAAAHAYFDKPAAQLTLPEAALLAGLVKNPSAYNPYRNPRNAQARRDVVLARMAEVGSIDRQQADAAARTPIALRRGAAGTGCDSSYAPFFCDYVKRVVLTDPVFGATAEDRTRLLFRGGITVRTTLDPRMQRAAQKALSGRIDKTDKVAGTTVSTEPGTGHIKTMAVSRDFGEGRGGTTLNLAVDRAMGGSNGVQPGSAFKPFLAAEALAQGYGLRYGIDSPYQLKDVGPVETCRGTTDTDEDEPYRPRNETRSEDGIYDMSRAMEKSINTYFIQLEERIGLCGAQQRVERMGVRRADGSPLDQVQSWTLGTNQVSPLTMAAAYATFASRGTYCTPVAIVSATDRTGKPLAVPAGRCEEVMEPELADAVNELLQGVVDRGTGRTADIGRPQAGKTGTHERQTAWFVGYTPDLAAAVAVWNPQPPRGGYELASVRIGSRFYRKVQGASLPAPIWAAAMGPALKDVPKSSFREPPSDYVEGTRGPGDRKVELDLDLGDGDAGRDDRDERGDLGVIEELIRNAQRDASSDRARRVEPNMRLPLPPTSSRTPRPTSSPTPSRDADARRAPRSSTPPSTSPSTAPRR